MRDQNTRAFTNQEYQVASTISRYLSDNISKYEQLLVSGGSLFDVKRDVSKGDWTQFYESMHVDSQYPALLGLGYSVYVPSDQLGAHTESMRQQGNQSYQIRPNNPGQNTYVPVVYLEPSNPTNTGAVGFDMYSEATRREAVQSAIESGKPVLSAPVILGRDADSTVKQYGSIMFYPIYKPDAPHGTIEERKANIQGFTFVVFRPQDIFTSIPGKLIEGEVTGVQLSDMTTKPLEMYSVKYGDKPTGSAINMTQLFDVSNRTWQVRLQAFDTVTSRRLAPSIILVAGAIMSILIAILVYAGLLHRLHRIQRLHDIKLQKSKDELLAIASHQLRTPASGVKQYVGMLLQGFMGELTGEQKEIADKAYQANERQLEIINELLYVAKADAGQLFIDRTPVHIHELTQGCISELRPKAEAKNIQIKLRGKRSAMVEADAQFVRMIIENLISNAIKYSYPDSTVTVTIQQDTTHLLVNVKDEGVGITKAQIESLFKKFSRVENPLSRSEGGKWFGSIPCTPTR